jgi:hypothetical protein
VPGAGNIIAYNNINGVQVEENVGSATGNRIQANAIFTNTALGIDLIGPGGVNANDGPGDPDLGPNNLQNYPVLTGASSSATTITITGAITSALNTTFSLEFFTNSVCDPSGNGEGEKFLGAADRTTDATGFEPFIVSFPVPIPLNGQFVTATATDPNGNTSEFSACEPVP